MSYCLLILTALLATAPDVQVGTLDGGTVTGTLVSLSPESVVVNAAGQDQTIAADKLLFLAPQAAPQPATSRATAWLELTDGSKLAVASLGIKAGTATVTFGNDEKLELPAKALRQIRFSQPDDPANTAWPADVGQDAAGDLLAVKKKDSIDFLEGVVADVTDENVEFEFQGEKIPVKRNRVDGIVFYHKASDRAPPSAAALVEDAAGWQLQAAKVTLADDAVEITTLAGPVVRRPFSDIRRIDYSSGKLVFLGDIEPDSVEWKPYFEFAASPALAQFYAPRRNIGRELQPLQLAGTKYSKGISLASRTKVTYRVPAGATRFKALAGIDDAVRDHGAVQLTISADGKELFAGPIVGKDAPRELDLDLTGARRLTILVDYGDNLDAGDYLNLADARIVK